MKNRLAALFALALIAQLPGCAKAAPEATCTKSTVSGLGYEVIAEGKGAPPAPDDAVTVAYKGTLAATGTVFDQNEDATFPVAGVVPGFAEGVQLMKPGGKIRLCIPARLGYGPEGGGPIPPNADLVFTVTLKSVQKPHVASVHGAEERVCKLKTPSGLGYSVIKAGTGGHPESGGAALVGYTGYLAADGKEFDASERAAFPVDGVIPGFTEGLKLMQRGSSYKLCIPSALGYGPGGSGPIPANADLVFDVNMLDFKSAAEMQAMRARQQGGQ